MSPASYIFQTSQAQYEAFLFRARRGFIKESQDFSSTIKNAILSPTVRGGHPVWTPLTHNMYFYTYWVHYLLKEREDHFEASIKRGLHFPMFTKMFGGFPVWVAAQLC